MLRLSLFLLLSLALHAASWLLHDEAQPPAFSAAQTREAPQVLRLAAVLQQAEPAPVKLPEQPQPQPQPQRQVVVPRKSPAPKPVVQAPVAKATPAVAAQPTQNQPGASAANRGTPSVGCGACSGSSRARQACCYKAGR